MIPKQVKIAITLDNDDLHIMSFLVFGRGTVLPLGGVWINKDLGWWQREPIEVNIADELCRAFPCQDIDGLRRPQPVRWRIVDDTEIPIDRTYRAAWKDVDGKIVHDMSRARDIHMRRLRADRNAALDQVDKDWMCAFGQGQTEVAARQERVRQVLRDMPTRVQPALEAAETIDELKRVR